MAAVQTKTMPAEQGQNGRLWKFLVVVDDTPEFLGALRFASLRAAKIKGMVTLLCVLPPADFQHWAAVQELMREEALEEARAQLDGYAARVRDMAGLEPEVVIREGKAQDEILSLINQDRDIHILVLGAAKAETPGPLVAAFSGPLLQSLRVPVLFVPGTLSEEAIDRLV